jgi:hypothetical protein
MKLGHSLLVFTALLLTGSLASASSSALTSSPVSPANGGVALMTPADGTPGCPTDELAFLNPAPSERAFSPCGPCSGVCAGVPIGQICGPFSGGQYPTCQVPYAERCADRTFKCYCWLGPLP